MIIGNKKTFAFELKLKSIKEHKCEISLFIDGKNICAFKHENDANCKTTRWNLDELINYLDSTLAFINNDKKFPFDINGECAAELDNNARDFDSENEFEMEKYYDSLNDWSYVHSWHHASSGAILADVFFRKVNNGIEISWWSDQEKDINFKYPYGYSVINFDTYEETVKNVIKTYNNFWL